MNKYRIRYTLNGKWQEIIERNGTDMNNTLRDTKAELKAIHGVAMGGIIICGDQGGGVYSF